MAAAENYVWVNCGSMTFLARQAFAKMFEGCQLRCVWLHSAAHRAQHAASHIHPTPKEPSNLEVR